MGYRSKNYEMKWDLQSRSSSSYKAGRIAELYAASYIRKRKAFNTLAYANILMVASNEYHLTVYIDKSLKAKIKKKVYDSGNTDNPLLLKECVSAGLIQILNKSEREIKNIIKRYSSGGGK